MSAKQTVTEMLAHADVRIGGDRPWDIQVTDEGFYSRCLSEASLGIGEAYMDGWWDCPHVDQFIDKVLRAGVQPRLPPRRLIPEYLKAKFTNLQKKSRAFVIGERHYDIGNDLYVRMLDKRLVYSCAYWNGAQNLDEAQEKKLELICRKLDLKPGMSVLDIGCGWGSLCQYLTEHHDVRVVGITVSKKQLELAQKRCHALPVEIRLQDYREIDDHYDRIVSVGMFEHVGYKNYARYMRTVAKCLKDDGVFLLQTIGRNSSGISIDPWIAKYIFPNSMLPSIGQIGAAIENVFVMEDWHNLNTHYEKTLMAWFDNFTKRWDEIKDRYDDRFYRMWTYYLLLCAGAFRARDIQVWQILFSKPGREAPLNLR